MSYTNLLCHIIFRTKCSKPTICEDHCTDLYKYIWGIIIAKHCTLYRINGMPDHIHLLVEMAPSVALSDLMRAIKTSSNKFIKEHLDWYPMFEGWADEYCALSKSQEEKEKIRQYIMNQKEHHKKFSWKEEMELLMKESGLEDKVPYFIK